MEQQHKVHFSQRFGAWLFALLLRYDIEPLELLSGVAATGWGLIVAYPGVNTFASSSTFAILSALAPEWLWGLVVFGVGLLQISSLWRATLGLRRHAAFVALLMWSILSVSFIVANSWSTATAIYPTLVANALWAYLRLSVDMRRGQP